MNSFFKRAKPDQSPDAEPQPKRPRLVPASDDPSLSPYPRRVAYWNCNGLSARLRSDSDTRMIKSFLSEYTPDILFLSEVRLPADHSAVPKKPTPQSKWFRHRIRRSDANSIADHNLVQALLASEECRHYKPYFSLADTKYAGTAMLINTRTTAAPVSVRFNMDAISVPRSVHNHQGRVIVAKFPAFSILHTYSPNNGWNEDHFQRRREWDKSVLSFMERKKNAGVRMMWVGDLNVAPEDMDLSHAIYFRRQKGGRNSPDGGASVRAEDIGQPGCTDGERRRFGEIVQGGDLVDAFRAKTGVREDGDTADDQFTWRGVVGGKHATRGMRIDHCIVSRSLLAAVQEVRVLGVGKERAGFMGSDHCPVLTVVREEAERIVGEQGEAEGGAGLERGTGTEMGTGTGPGTGTGTLATSGVEDVGRGGEDGDGDGDDDGDGV